MKQRSDADHHEKMKKVQAAHEKKLAGKTIEKGLVIVNTGPGKGKTSAALGMIVRAIGHGMKVGVVQFVKGAMETGEKAVFDRFPDQIEFKPMGEGFTWNTQDRAQDVASARAGWERAKRMIEESRREQPAYDVVILDELNIAVHYEYLPIEEIVPVLASKPRELSIVITGRGAKPELIAVADTVTEMRPLKHAYEVGVKARKGIEF